MLQRDFGRTGLQVSALGFGAAHVGSDQCGEAEAEQVLNMVLDEGINLIDTARGYGSSEERIGRFLAHRRDEYILSSKCGYMIDGTQDWTGECITRGIDRALATMRTDRIDVMHLHSCERHVLENSDVVPALVRAREQGKIRLAAYSGENEHRRYAIELGAFDVIQTSLNVCDQMVLEHDLPEMHRRGIGVIAKRPIGNVFWRFSEQPHGDYAEQYWLRARAMGLSPEPLSWLEFALRFAAFQEGVSTIIAGTAKLGHLRENVRLLELGPLPAELQEKARSLFRQHGSEWRGEV